MIRMCKFFSFISDGKGNVSYFNAKQRNTLKGLDFDFHTRIARYFLPNRFYRAVGSAHQVNKFEFVNGEFAIVQLNTDDDSAQVRKWCEEFVKTAEFQDIMLYAVLNEALEIRFIKSPSETIQLAVVLQDAYLIRFIDSPSEFVQMVAVMQDGYAIQCIAFSSELVKLAAVCQNGYSIECIDSPSEIVQLAAVQQNIYAIRGIASPFKSVKDLCSVLRNSRTFVSDVYF